MGDNGFVKEFWDLFEVMNKKGYRISKGVQNKVLERFQKDGLGGDVEKLKVVYASGLVGNSMEKVVQSCVRLLGVKYGVMMLKGRYENWVLSIQAIWLRWYWKMLVWSQQKC